MPKRSLMDQLDQAVSELLATPGAKPQSENPELLALLRIAAGLRELPRENFKARLKSDLERKSSMATVAEPVAAIRQAATPYLTVRDAASAIDFYKKAFGAVEKGRLADTSGKIGHAEITIGGATIMLADEFPDYGAISPATLGGSPVK
ncbi:MAG TPA: VOC family protein, partial [Terriglobales bacterium]|nr:VOC family protein [Terriglobales bacterium]